MLNKSHEEYLSSFRANDASGRPESGIADVSITHEKYPADSRLAKAYEVALDIRKFEIELYWKRSNSFWLIVAALGALLIGSLSARGIDDNVKSLVAFGICALASVVAYAWSLVNRAGKFWQRNWEYQVDVLEDGVLGPLYKTVFSKRSPKDEPLYSVSKLNLALSHCVTAAFMFGAAISLPIPIPGAAHASSCMYGKLLFVLFAIVAATYIARVGKAESAKSGISDLTLHYTRRSVGSLTKY